MADSFKKRNWPLFTAYYGALGIITLCCTMWVLYWMMSSEPFTTSYDTYAYLDRLDKHIPSRFFRTDGGYGSALIYQAAPFIIVALLSFVVVALREKIKEKKKKELEETGGMSPIKSNATGSSWRSYVPNLATMPLVIRSPLGVLSAADTLFLSGIVFLCVYAFGREMRISLAQMVTYYQDHPEDLDGESLLIIKVAYSAYYLGRVAMIPFSLLWVPVSRGSPFLRLINMPFEHAVKYHIWLAMICLAMLLGHSVLYIAYYVHSGYAKEILMWYKESEYCSVIAGLIAMIAGLIMWVTSLSFFRRRWYEIFFGIHHLYIVFFVFWLYHVMWTIHFVTIPVLLFVIDRFLRFVQSRRSVDVLSAKLLESGSIELNIAKSSTEGLRYYALSSWYLRFSNLSKLMKFEWHFFSVTSTEMDEKEELSIVIKPLGKWTEVMKQKIFKYTNVDNGPKRSRCPFTFRAGVEGPYGDETDFFLKYNVLVLVGGGIGVTPLLALLRDVLHRYRLGEKNLPTKIHLFHCVRKPEELCVMNDIDPNEILPNYQNHGLDLYVSVYVTSTSPSDYGSAIGSDNTNQVLDLATTEGLSHRKGSSIDTPQEVFFSKSGPNAHSISSVSTRGDAKWVGSIFLASFVGYYVLWGLANVFLIRNIDAYFTNYSRTHVVVACMILGTVLFGGIPTFLWWLKIKQHQKSRTLARTSSKVGILNGSPSANLEMESYHVSSNDEENLRSQRGSPWNGTLRVRSRPSWKETFVSLNKEYQGQDIGVLVSGGLGMQEDVAKECRSYSFKNLFKKDASANKFHYHPISFDI